MAIARLCIREPCVGEPEARAGALGVQFNRHHGFSAKRGRSQPGHLYKRVVLQPRNRP